MENIRTDFVNEVLDHLNVLHNSAITEQEKELVLNLLISLHESIEPADSELKKEWNKWFLTISCKNC